MEGCKT